MWKTEKAACFRCNVGEVAHLDVFADDIEEIAMLTALCVSPFACWSFLAISQSDIHRAARRIAYITDLPVLALATPGIEIMAAHRLGIAAKTVRQIGSTVLAHQADSRSDMRAMP